MFAKDLPFYKFCVTLYQTKNAQLFLKSFVSDPIQLEPILDQFYRISRPYTRINGLKTIPSPAAHNRIANIWEYPQGESPCVKWWRLRLKTFSENMSKISENV